MLFTQSSGVWLKVLEWNFSIEAKKKKPRKNKVIFFRFYSILHANGQIRKTHRTLDWTSGL